MDPINLYDEEDSEEPETKNDLVPNIWVNKRGHTVRDMEATEILLNLRLAQNEQFMTGGQRKYLLWNKIADELVSAGYQVGFGAAGAERCRQKFSNLRKAYIHYVINFQKTGVGRAPEFLELLQAIIGDVELPSSSDQPDFSPKLEIIQVKGNDSEQEQEQEQLNQDHSYEVEELNLVVEKDTNEITTTTTSPEELNQKLLKELVAERRDRQKNFVELRDMFKTHMKQLERFMNLFEKMLNPPQTTKRKRHDSSDSA